MADPRRPDYDPANDPARPVGPGPVDRGVADSMARDPYAEPRAANSSRGLAGATIAVAVVLLAVLAFAFMGGTGTDEAALPPGTVAEDPNNPATGAIEPDTAPISETQPAPVSPIDGTQPAPVDGTAPVGQPAPVQ